MSVVRAQVTLIQIKGGSLKKRERKEYVFESASFGLKWKFNFGCGVFKNHQIATFRDIEIYVSGRSLKFVFFEKATKFDKISTFDQ